MRLASFYLIICSLLLASFAAEDGQYGLWDDVQQLDSSGQPIADSYGQDIVEPFERELDSFDSAIIKPFNDTTEDEGKVAQTPLAGCLYLKHGPLTFHGITSGSGGDCRRPGAWRGLPPPR